jgi:hypothetical protein
MSRVHRVKDENSVIRRYQLIPYSDLAVILKEGETAFLEDSAKQKLRRQTIWKATRKLSQMVGKSVVAQRGFLKVENGANLEGYLFCAT